MGGVLCLANGGTAPLSVDLLGRNGA